MEYDHAEVVVDLEDAGEQSGCARFQMIVNRRLKVDRTEGEDGPQAAVLQLSQSQVTTLNAMWKEMPLTTTEVRYGSNIY